MHDYGVLLANEEGKWLFSQLNDEGNETISEGFTGPLQALRILDERGWDVVAVDISDTALGRAAEAAKSRGVAERIEFIQRDLSDEFPDGTYDLISAQFLHSMVRLDRTSILANAAAALRDGGLLVIVDQDARLDRQRQVLEIGVAGNPDREAERRNGAP